MRKTLFILFLFLSVSSLAQSVNDSVQKDPEPPKRDTSPIPPKRNIVPKNIVRVKANISRAVDSVARIIDSVRKDSILKERTAFAKDSMAKASMTRDSILYLEEIAFFRRLDTSIYNRNPFYRFNNPVRMIAVKRQSMGKEATFYSIIALLLFFAVVKNTFSRYLDDLFRVFFRTTLKQRQTRDQLMSAPLPSLIYNILYALSAALFITLLFQHFQLGSQYNFWVLFVYSILGLIAVYTIKFIALKFFGWMLGISEATNTYIFIVFTTNKVIGIFLLPFIVGLAFMDSMVYEAVFMLSVCMLGAIFLYRFYLSFISVRKQISINLFHFLLYILAFEVVPLLLINKLLVRFFSETL